jgi:hypothetical protein
LDGTDRLGATSWLWCAGLVKNCNGRPGVAGTTCCCWWWSARGLCAEAADDEDEEVEEASWWREWPLLLLLLAMVAMGKADGRANSEVSLMLRLRSESPNASPNEFLPPPPLSPPAAVSDPTPWNEFCNESMEQEK